MLPFTAEQFFAVFGRYNDAIWPTQAVAAAAGLAALVLLFVRRPYADTAIAWILAAMWLWTGMVYHAVFFAGINRLAYLFAAFFAGQAVLLYWQASRLQFAGASMPAAMGGFALIAYASIAYPLVGLAAGHAYPAMPLFGVTPCPVTLFTLGMLLLAPSAPWALFAVPILWSLIGGSAAFLLDVPQDWPLLIAGPFAAVLLRVSRSDPA